MKNRLFALLLIVALVVAVSVFAVGAETTAENPFAGKTTEVVHAHCEGCGQEVDWYPAPTSINSEMQLWPNADKSHHFYLTADSMIGSNTTLDSADDVYCLNLNGFRWTKTGDYYFFMIWGGGKLNLMDTSVDQTGVMDHPFENSGNRHIYLDGNGTVNQYGGKLLRSVTTGATGGCVYMANNCVYNMYGGSMEANTTNASGGGVVSMVGGTFNMYDGASMNGTSTNYGGAVYLKGGGTFNMEGGTITGYAELAGGAVYIVGNSTFNMKGGTMLNCRVADDCTNGNLTGTPMWENAGTASTNRGRGGAVMVELGTFNMSGGTIDGGKGANNYAWQNNNASYGGAVAVASGKVSISGDAMIKNCSAGMYGGAILVYHGTYWASASAVGTYDNPGSLEITGGTIKDNFTWYQGGAIHLFLDVSANITGGKIYGNTSYSTAYAPNIYMSGSSATAKAQLTFGGTAQLGPDTAPTAATCGQNGAGIMANENAIINIEGGTIKNLWTSGSGGVIHTNSMSVSINMTGGLIDNCRAANGGFLALNCASPTTISGGTIQNCVAEAYGGAIANYATNAAPITLGGNVVIANCSAKRGGAVAMVVNGGTLTMNNGTINNCYAAWGGGAVYLEAGAIFNMANGELLNCTTDTTSSSADVSYPMWDGAECYNEGRGGAVYVECGTFTMDGGTIDGGVATNASYGGAIAVGSGTVTINENVVIKNCSAGMYGGAITVFHGQRWKLEGSTYVTAYYDIPGALVMNGGTIQDCSTPNNGGAILVYSGSIDVNGGTIKDCTSKWAGGGVYLFNNVTNATFENLTVENCATTNSSGGNVYLGNNVVATFTNCDIKNGSAVYDGCAGGNIFVGGAAGGANATFTDCYVVGGKTSAANGRGANIASLKSDVTLNGDTVISGKDAVAMYMGWNISMYGGAGTLTLEDNATVQETPSYIVNLSVAIEPGSSVILADNATVDDLTVRHSGGTMPAGAVTVKSGFTGQVYVTIDLGTLSATFEPGVEIGDWMAQDGYENTGIIKLHQVVGEDWTLRLLADNGDTFKVATMTAVKDGVETGLLAMPESGDYDYIKLYDGVEVALNQDTTVHLNGQAASFATNGNELTVIDTATNDCTTAGASFTVDNPEDLVRYAKNEANGYQYVIVEKNGTFTSNRVQVTLDYLSIKPSQTGMYYTTTIKANVEATGVITFYGTAVSLGQNEITDDFLNDSAVMYTSFGAENIKTDADGNASMTTNSALVYGILTKGGEYNERNAGMKIKANSYICVDLGGGNDMYIMADESFEYSLNDAMEMLNGAVGKMTPSQQESAANFYKTWADVFAGLDLPELEALAA